MLKYESWEMRQELHFEDLLKDLIHRAAFSPSRTILSMTSPTILLSRESEDELGKDEICQLRLLPTFHCLMLFAPWTAKQNF